MSELFSEYELRLNSLTIEEQKFFGMITTGEEDLKSLVSNFSGASHHRHKPPRGLRATITKRVIDIEDDMSLNNLFIDEIMDKEPKLLIKVILPSSKAREDIFLLEDIGLLTGFSGNIIDNIENLMKKLNRVWAT